MYKHTLTNEDVIVEETLGCFIITVNEYLDLPEGAESVQIPYDDEGLTFCFVEKEDGSFEFCRAYADPEDFFPEIEDAFEYIDAFWPYLIKDGDELMPEICDVQETDEGYLVICYRYSEEMNTLNEYIVENKKREAKFNIKLAFR